MGLAIEGLGWVWGCAGLGCRGLRLRELVSGFGFFGVQALGFYTQR